VDAVAVAVVELASGPDSDFFFFFLPVESFGALRSGLFYTSVIIGKTRIYLNIHIFTFLFRVFSIVVIVLRQKLH
jgi:hypothetical protein